MSRCMIFAFLLALAAGSFGDDPSKPYDRHRWLADAAETTDDLRRVPQAPGYADHDGTIVLVGGRVWDGTGAPARPATLITRGKRIAEILSPGEDDYPENSAVVRVDGLTVMPGLIDLHVHITYVKDFGQPPELAAKSQADAALRGIERLRHYLESGVTSVRDLASHGMAPFLIARYIEEGQLPGPRVYSAGQLITGTGGHGTEHYLQKTAPRYPDASIREASGADDWRQAVREQFKRGANLIKLASHYSFDEVKAAIDEAHDLGLQVTVDAETHYIEMAVRAGADCIEHPLPRTKETIRLMQEYGVAGVPTLVAYQYINAGGGYYGSTSRRFTLTDETIMDMFRTLDQANIKQGIGTDMTGTLYRLMPAPYIKELNNFMAIGYTAAEALGVATKTNAEILGLGDKLGTLETGKLADVIVVGGKPDETVEDIANIVHVIVNGRFKVKHGRLFIPRHEPATPPVK